MEIEAKLDKVRHFAVVTASALHRLSCVGVFFPEAEGFHTVSADSAVKEQIDTKYVK